MGRVVSGLVGSPGAGRLDGLGAFAVAISHSALSAFLKADAAAGDGGVGAAGALFG